MMRTYIQLTLTSSTSALTPLLTMFTRQTLIPLMATGALLFGCQESSLSDSGQRSRAESSSESRPELNLESSSEVRRDDDQEVRPALDESEFTLELRLVERSADQLTARLHYTRRDSQVAPRTAEIFLEYPEELTISQVKRLEATERAEKDLIVQHPSPGRARLIWMSIGHLGTLDSGPLAEITLRGRPSARSAIHILSLPDKPWFAPSAANEGVSVSEPLLFGVE